MFVTIGGVRVFVGHEYEYHQRRGLKSMLVLKKLPKDSWQSCEPTNYPGAHQLKFGHRGRDIFWSQVSPTS